MIDNSPYRHPKVRNMLAIFSTLYHSLNAVVAQPKNCPFGVLNFDWAPKYDYI